MFLSLITVFCLNDYAPGSDTNMFESALTRSKIWHIASLVRQHHPNQTTTGNTFGPQITLDCMGVQSHKVPVSGEQVGSLVSPIAFHLCEPRDRITPQTSAQFHRAA